MLFTSLLCVISLFDFLHLQKDDTWLPLSGFDCVCICIRWFFNIVISSVSVYQSFCFPLRLEHKIRLYYLLFRLWLPSSSFIIGAIATCPRNYKNQYCCLRIWLCVCLFSYHVIFAFHFVTHSLYLFWDEPWFHYNHQTFMLPSLYLCFASSPTS